MTAGACGSRPVVPVDRLLGRPLDVSHLLRIRYSRSQARSAMCMSEPYP